jgi:hypothetical protein
MTPSVLLALFHHLFNLYPPGFRAEYGEEIQMVFDQTLECKQGWSAWRFVLRELVNTPPVLMRLYCREWRSRGVRSAFSTPELPMHDGRHSWGLAGIEVLFFLVWTGLLVLLTYADFAWLRPGWYRDLTVLGNMVVVLPLPIILLGLGRGLPRWVYPFFGLLLAYLCQTAWRFHLELFLAVCFMASCVLAAAAVWVNARRPLPPGVLHLGRSLQLDPLRWSFAVYGAAPLLILLAYDDGYANDHTPYLCCSALGMLLGGLLYTRLNRPLGRVAALAAGLTLATWISLLDRSALTGSIQPGDLATILGLWALAMAFIVIPPVIPGAFGLFTRMFKQGR